MAGYSLSYLHWEERDSLSVHYSQIIEVETTVEKEDPYSVDLMLAARIPLLYSDELGTLSLTETRKNGIFSIK